MPFTNACAENGAPESLRHITQWHMDTAAGLPVSVTETAPHRHVPERVTALTESITYSLFKYVSSGLFERHRLTFSTQLAVKIALQQGIIKASSLI